MKNILFVIYIFLPFCLLAQKPILADFIINGQVNVDTGTITLEMSEVKELYPSGFENLKVKIKDGKFIMVGKTDYPIWGAFRIADKYVSASTPIERGSQSIILNIDSNYQTPQNSNSIAHEIETYDKFFMVATEKSNKYHIHYDSLSKIFKGKFSEEIAFSLQKEMRESFVANDSSLLEYVKINSNSYYALFRLYHLIDFGFNDRLGATFEHFSELLKNSRQGHYLYQKILIAKIISVGSLIPQFNVLNMKGKKIDINQYSHNKYTLIDLWYSHCAPCIAQFDDLKNIRHQYLGKGFEILGISTDKEKYRKDWQDAIVKYKLPWPQYLDLNGVDTRKLNIKIFPTNFLVNQSGKIVASNISPIELKYFLKENLN